MKIWAILILAALLLVPSGYAKDMEQDEEEAQELGKPFSFTEPDEKLLEEANQLDRLYKRRGVLYSDPELDAYLQKVAGTLHEKIEIPEKVQWEIHALRDPMVNAFALPNGSIYINSGLLALLENEAQLAGILGHEISHVTLRHSYLYNRSTRKKMVIMHVLSAVGSAGGMFPAGSAFGMTIQIASGISQTIVASMIYGYSRNIERAADKSGLLMLTDAQFDPHVMPRTFTLLDEKLEFEPVEVFYRTHPKLEERTAYTTAMADEQPPVANPRGTSTADYLSHVAEIIRYNVQADIDSRRYRTAVARASRLTSWQSDNPAYISLLADAYSALGARTSEPTPEEQTKKEQKKIRKRFLNLTVEEEEKELLSTPAGKQAAEANKEKAEQLYREAIARNPDLPDPHKGLGMLRELTGRNQEAMEQYQEFLRLAPDSPERLRIQRRIEDLGKPVLRK